MEKNERAAGPKIVEYNLKSDSWHVVAPIRESLYGDLASWWLAEVGWSEDEKNITLHYKAHGDETYRNDQSAWRYAKTAPSGLPQAGENQGETSPGLFVSIHQSLNIPPTLFASMSSSEPGQQIWDPNQQFQTIDLGEAKRYNWKDSQGRTVKGVLFLPLHYASGKRYPLVIEPRAYSQELFIMDGTYSTAVAARAMAAVGIAVLEAGEPEVQNKDEQWQKHNLEYALDGYRSGISKLAADGIVDPEEAGIIGFSRTCANALYAITKQPSALKAATIANGVVDGYMQFVLSQDLYALPGITSPNYRAHYGGPPYGPFLVHYLKDNPTFNLDKVRAAVRIETHGPMDLLYDWETYSGLKTLRRPVDMVMLPYAGHVVSMPNDVMESEQGDVDWFRFWLQGYEDPDPTKASQYVRWRHLRELRDGDQTNSR